MVCLSLLTASLPGIIGQLRSAELPASEEVRVTSGLQVLYDFSALEGTTIPDRADAGDAINLVVEDPKAVRLSDAGLEILRPTIIRSETPPARLILSIQQSGAVTIEAWVRTARLEQQGPARIITLSRNPNERNLTLGQNGPGVEVRLRTEKTSTNGMPALVSQGQAFGTPLTHLVYTRDPAGRARLYVDGRLNAETTIGGNLTNWDGQHVFALANELSGDRPWLGTYRLVAIYSRDLAPSEVEHHFRLGPAVQSDPTVLAERQQRQLFETQIAPLLSRHCLECHDPSNREGGLDLSQRVAALEGGDSGPVLQPGRVHESRMWELIETDEMPHERPALSAEEKQLLRTWIESGAMWSLETIDPALYARASGPSQAFVQRLTVPEYIETVRSTLGIDIAREAGELLPPDLRADGFSNTAYNLNVDLAHVEAYARLAELIAERVDVKALATKYTTSRALTDENVTEVIRPVGRLLLRSPLSDEEIAAYCGISTAVAGAGGDFDEALRYILEAMLQSPRFVYRIENQRGGGSAWPVSQYELASRLSYILWGGPPDELLLDAAEKGTLAGAGLEAQVRRMLQDERAMRRSRQFIAEWLHLDHLSHLNPDPGKFPDWDKSLAAEMRAETLAFFEEVVWKEQRPLADLLNARFTYVTPRLARHYGIPLDAERETDRLVRVDLSSVPGRGGLLTQGSVLTVGGDDASMVTRGLFVMHELLRGVVRDPPPCVDTTPVSSRPGLSQRAIAESRIANQSCTGCHSKFEPLAFAFERFDGLGSYHETDEHGNALRADGTILFPGQPQPIMYKSTEEFLNLLAGSSRVQETLTWKLTQFAIGRPLGAEDAAILADIHHRAQQTGGTYTDVMTAIVTSDLVRMARAESGSQPVRNGNK